MSVMRKCHANFTLNNFTGIMHGMFVASEKDHDM